MPVMEQEVEKTSTNEMTPVMARVAQVRKETYDTFTLALEPWDGEPFRPFAPGQFSMLYVFGNGELPISISGDPEDHSRLLYTVRSVGKTTQALVSSKPGDALGIRGPYGSHWPLKVARGKDVLIVAGGIGLAPLRPAVHYILRHRADYNRLIVLYGARSPRDLIFHKQLEDWSRLPDTQVLSTVDYGGLSGWSPACSAMSGYNLFTRWR
jgi:NAD(P)H-flavin reductase